jgi:hypothetical protein
MRSNRANPCASEKLAAPSRLYNRVKHLRDDVLLFGGLSPAAEAMRRNPRGFRDGLPGLLGVLCPGEIGNGIDALPLNAGCGIQRALFQSHDQLREDQHREVVFRVAAWRPALCRWALS